MAMNEKLEKAVQYLRDRKKYITDPKCKFRPTSSAHTDITKTVEAYRQEVLLEPKVKVVKDAKR
jgi:hypothetical protein